MVSLYHIIPYIALKPHKKIFGVLQSHCVDDDVVDDDFFATGSNVNL